MGYTVQPGNAVSLEQTRAEAAETNRLEKLQELADLPDIASARMHLGVVELAPVLVVATANVNTTTAGLATIDGVTLTAGARVLLTGQTAGAQNGVWIAATTAWTRPDDFENTAVIAARTVTVMQGTVHAHERWLLDTTGSLTIGTTSQTWTLLSAATSGSPGATGPTGATGPSAWSTVTAWVSGTPYVKGPPASVVTNGGATFVCVSDVTSATVPGSDGAHWKEVASKGLSGAAGTAGGTGGTGGTGGQGAAGGTGGTGSQGASGSAGTAGGTGGTGGTGPAGATGAPGSGVTAEQLVTLWTTGESIIAGEQRMHASIMYIALDPHTAGATFAGDAAHWAKVGAGGGTGASGVSKVNGLEGAVTVTPALIGAVGYIAPAEWTPGTVYSTGQQVINAGKVYVAADPGTYAAWVSGAPYVTSQLVLSVGIKYACTANVTSATAPASDPTHWKAIGLGQFLSGATFDAGAQETWAQASAAPTLPRPPQWIDGQVYSAAQTVSVGGLIYIAKVGHEAIGGAVWQQTTTVKTGLTLPSGTFTLEAPTKGSAKFSNAGRLVIAGAEISYTGTTTSPTVDTFTGCKVITGVGQFISTGAVIQEGNWQLLAVKVRTEYVWVQDFGARTGTNWGNQAPAIQAALDRAAEGIENQKGVVSGEPGAYELGDPLLASKGRTMRQYKSLLEPFGKVWAHLHIPEKGVCLHGSTEHGGMWLRAAVGCGQLDTPEIEKGGGRAYIIGIARGTGVVKGQRILSDLEITSLEAADPASDSVSGSRFPPKIIDGILYSSAGTIYRCKIGGNLRGAIIMRCDHANVTETDMGGWARLIWPTFMGPAGNNQIDNCGMVGGFCGVYVEPGAICGATVFKLGHFGFNSGPCFYKLECSKSGEGFVGGVILDRMTIEEPSGGVMVDSSMESNISRVWWLRTAAGRGAVGALGGRRRGDVHMPLDAIIKAQSLHQFYVDGGLLTNSGYDPQTGCVIRLAGEASSCDFGDITDAIVQVRGQGLPFMRAGSQSNLRATYHEDSQSPEVAVYFRTVEGPATVAKWDVIAPAKPVIPGGIPAPEMLTRRHEKQGERAGGLALLSCNLKAGEVFHLPTARRNEDAPGSLYARLGHLGSGGVGTSTLSTKPTSNQALTASSGQTLNVESTRGFPPTGALSMTGLGTVTYTGITATSFTGVTSGTAFTAKTTTACLLVTWPVNPRGATAKTVGTQNFGESRAIPTTMHAMFWNSDAARRGYLSGASDFPTSGGLACVAGSSIFRYKQIVPEPITTVVAKGKGNADNLQVASTSGFPEPDTHESMIVKFAYSKKLVGEGTAVLSFWWNNKEWTTPAITVWHKAVTTIKTAKTSPYTLPFSLDLTSTAGLLPSGIVNVLVGATTYEIRYTSISGTVLEGCEFAVGVGPPELTAGAAVTQDHGATAAEVATALTGATSGAENISTSGTFTATGGPLGTNEVVATAAGGITGNIRMLAVVSESTSLGTGSVVTFIKVPIAAIRVGNQAASYGGMRAAPTTVTTAATAKGISKIKCDTSSFIDEPGMVTVTTSEGTIQVTYTSADHAKNEIIGIPGKGPGSISFPSGIPISTTLTGNAELTSIQPGNLGPPILPGTVVQVDGTPAFMYGLSGGSVVAPGSLYHGGAGVKQKLTRAIEVDSLSGFSATGGIFTMEPEAGNLIWSFYSSIAETEAQSRYIGKEVAFPLVAWASGKNYKAGEVLTNGGNPYLCTAAINGGTTAPPSDTSHWEPWVIGLGDTFDFPNTSGTKIQVLITGSTVPEFKHVTLTYTAKSVATNESVGDQDINAATFVVTSTAGWPYAGTVRCFRSDGIWEIKYTSKTATELKGCTCPTEQVGKLPGGSQLSMEVLTGITTTGSGSGSIKSGALVRMNTPVLKKYLSGVTSEGYFKTSTGKYEPIPAGTVITDMPVAAIEGSSGYPAAPASIALGKGNQMPYRKVLAVAGGEASEEEVSDEVLSEEAAEEAAAEALEAGAAVENKLKAFVVADLTNANLFTTIGPNSNAIATGGTILSSAISHLNAVSALVVQSVENWPSSGVVLMGQAYATYSSVTEARTALNEAISLPGGTPATIKVGTSKGFPASGVVRIGGVDVTYTGKTQQETTLDGSYNTSSAAAINVVSTAGFAATGALSVGGVLLTYTGKSATTFTGVSEVFEGPIVPTGSAVTQATFTGCTSGSTTTAQTLGTVVRQRPEFLGIVGAKAKTLLSGRQTLSSGTLTVTSTQSFLTAGTIFISGLAITYTGKTATTFTGCLPPQAWASGTPYTPRQQVTNGGKTYECIAGTSGTTAPGSDTAHWKEIVAAASAADESEVMAEDAVLEVGQPVTLAYGEQVSAEQVLRARYSEASDGEGDKGLVAPMSGPADPNGAALCVAIADDQGALVAVEI